MGRGNLDRSGLIGPERGRLVGRHLGRLPHEPLALVLPVDLPAVQFLLEHALQTPKKLLAPAIVNRIKYAGVADDVMRQQKALLSSLLSGRRFRLLMDAEVLDREKAYSVLRFLTDVQDGVWS